MSTVSEVRAPRPRRDEVRRALLDAAAQVFARKGIDAASVDDVAAAAGFTKGAVYSNFGSKDGLVTAVADDRVTAYLDLGLDAVSDVEVPFVVRVQALGDRLTTAFDDQRDWTLLFLELWQRAVRSGRADTAFRERRRGLHASITAAIVHHFGETDTPLPLPPDEMATVLMALSNGLAIERHADPGAVPDDLLGRVLTLLMCG
jgi:AcrR family transcriptional regulator